MRIRYLITGMLLCISPWMAHATTLKEAMDMAGVSHPEFAMSELRVEAARAQLKEQRAYAYNPELSLEGQNRSLNGANTGKDYYISLSQGIELGGKGGYREEAAQAALDAGIQHTDNFRQQLRITVAKRFIEHHFAKQTLNIRSKQRVMLKDLKRAIQRRLDVGDANILEMNLANAAYNSSLSASIEAKQAFTVIQARYYTALGKFGGDQTFDPVLPRLVVDWKVPEDPVAIALQSRSDFAAIKSKVRQLNAEADLADVARIPDPTLSISGGREAGEKLVKVGVSFALPFWNSHTGAYKASLMEATRSKDEMAWREHQLRLEVQTALTNHSDAMQALSSNEKVELSASSLSNIKLAQTAYKAGELSFEGLVIHINQALDAHLTSLNIIKQAWLARIRLAEVLGRPEYILEGVQ